MQRPIIDAFRLLSEKVRWDRITKFEVNSSTDCIHIMTTLHGDYFRIRHVRENEASRFEIAEFTGPLVPLITTEDDWELVETVPTVEKLVDAIDALCL